MMYRAVAAPKNPAIMAISKQYCRQSFRSFRLVEYFISLRLLIARYAQLSNSQRNGTQMVRHRKMFRFQFVHCHNTKL